MISIQEYLLSKTKKSNSEPTIEANDDNIKSIVEQELQRLGTNADLNHIDTSKVTNMMFLFRLKRFSGDISEWDVSNVVSMAGMFQGCIEFNGDLSKWDVSGVKIMRHMFASCRDFDGMSIEKWNPKSVQTTEAMFTYCRLFNADISGWRMPINTDYSHMFDHCKSFSRNLSSWQISKYARTEMMFRDTPIARKTSMHPKRS